MTPEYLNTLADLADPDKLWTLPGMEQMSLPPYRRQRLDTGVALRRYAVHLRDVEALRGTGRSLLITPLSPNGSARRDIETPEDRRELVQDVAPVQAEHAALSELHGLLYTAQRCDGEQRAAAINKARLVLHKLREGKAPLQAEPVPVVASGVTLDFKQATELLEMFGGEPTEITLMTGQGHSGEGLYAVYNADPEGAVYLGATDEDATPQAEPVRQLPTAATVKTIMLGMAHDDRPGNLWGSSSADEKAIALKVLRVATLATPQAEPAVAEQARDVEATVFRVLREGRFPQLTTTVPVGTELMPFVRALVAALASQSTPPPESAERDFDAELEAADDGPPLIGRWHHGDGVLVSGSIRIAQWDCDTNPPTEFRERLLNWMCDTLNAALAANPTAQPDGGSKA